MAKGEKTSSATELAIRTNEKVDARTNTRKKWGDRCIDSGYQIFPDVLLKCQRYMGLEAIVVILLNITMQWWKQQELPYPRPSFIAKRMEVSTRTVERRVARMQKQGLLIRKPSEEVRGKTVRKFDLSGLITELTKYAEGSLAERGKLEEIPHDE
jgi:hypothetical protein